MPRYFKLLENYKTLKMALDWFRIWPSNDINEPLVREWVSKQCFAEIKSILVLNILIA